MPTSTHLSLPHPQSQVQLKSINEESVPEHVIELQTALMNTKNKVEKAQILYKIGKHIMTDESMEIMSSNGINYLRAASSEGSANASLTLSKLYLEQQFHNRNLYHSTNFFQLAIKQLGIEFDNVFNIKQLEESLAFCKIKQSKNVMTLARTLAMYHS